MHEKSGKCLDMTCWGEKVVQDDPQMKNHDNLEKDRRPY